MVQRSGYGRPEALRALDLVLIGHRLQVPQGALCSATHVGTIHVVPCPAPPGPAMELHVTAPGGGQRSRPDPPPLWSCLSRPGQGCRGGPSAESVKRSSAAASSSCVKAGKRLPSRMSRPRAGMWALSRSQFPSATVNDEVGKGILKSGQSSSGIHRGSLTIIRDQPADGIFTGAHVRL